MLAKASSSNLARKSFQFINSMRTDFNTFNPQSERGPSDNTTSLRWFFASSLPFPLFNPSLAVCGTELYVLDYKGSVFSCTLLQPSSAVKRETNVWQSLAKVPVEGSTLATLCGQLRSCCGGTKCHRRGWSWIRYPSWSINGLLAHLRTQLNMSA